MIPDRALWNELFAAADQFRQWSPWQWMDDTQVVGVRHPEGDDIGWCVVIGNLGQHFGLILYPGVAGWRSFRNLQERWPTAEDAAIDQTALSITFEDHGHLSRPMRQLCKTLRWKASARDAWPDAIDANGGYIPALMTEEDIPWMIRALHEVDEAAQMVKERPALLEPDAQGRLLVAEHHDDGGDTWERHEPPPYLRPIPMPFPFDEALANAMAASAGRMSGDWLVDWVRPFPVRIESAGLRPFFPHMLLMVDLPSDYIIAFHALEHFEQNFASEVMKRSGDRLPRRFLVRRPELLVQVSPLAVALGVSVEFRPELVEIVDATIARMREGLKRSSPDQSS